MTKRAKTLLEKWSKLRKAYFCWLFLKATSKMDCPICLEKIPELSEDCGVLVPELECNCAFFTHLHCWDSWSCINGGICLYCRYASGAQPIPAVEPAPLVHGHIIQQEPPRPGDVLKQIFAMICIFYCIVRMFLTS